MAVAVAMEVMLVALRNRRAVELYGMCNDHRTDYST